MQAHILARICKQVYQHFPEVVDAEPRVQELDPNQYLLVFKGTVCTEDGRKLVRTVRVTARADGQIVKMSTSR